jgi:NhaP-type Na+/H+ or K+/H+ antiporter
MVVMGLVIGNRGATKAMTERTREHLLNFWHLFDELLNLVLFGLICREVIALSIKLDVIRVGMPLFRSCSWVELSASRLLCLPFVASAKSARIP